MLDQFNAWLENHPRAGGWVLVFVTFVVYSGTLPNAFVYDDEHQIVENPFILNPRLWTRIFTGSVWSFQGVAVQTNFYRPLQFFTYWVVYRLAGPNPAAFHLFQILLYAATVWLVYRIGRELLRNEVAAFVGALLWALHPLHVEAIAWIASTPEAGFGFFYLLAFHLFLHAEKNEPHRLRWHGLAALAYFSALFYKEMALSLPLLLLAYWFFLGARESWMRRLVRWVPYLLAVAAYVEIRRMMLGHVSYVPSLWRISLKTVGAAVGLLGEHTRLFFWPTHLNVFRVFEIAPSLRSPWPWLTLLALGAALVLRKRQPLLSFLLAWWTVTLVPCLDIRQLSFPLLAERFSYVPSAALCLAIPWVLFTWLPQRLPEVRVTRYALPALLVVMISWTVQTVRAIPNWRDNERLVDYSLTQSPNAALLHVVQGLVLQYRQSDFGGATQEYQTALKLNAASLRPLASVTYDSYLGLGQIAHMQGRTDEAIRHFEKAVAVLPGYSLAFDALGSMYFPQQDYAKAAEYFLQAVTVNPQDLGARFYLGTCWMKLGKFREAAAQFRAAREVDPTFREAYEAEARALEAAGDPGAATRVRSLAVNAQEE